MLLMIVMVIMIVSSALMLALFSSFLPFVRNYGNVAQYTTAYYGALSAVELVLGLIESLDERLQNRIKLQLEPER